MKADRPVKVPQRSRCRHATTDPPGGDSHRNHNRSRRRHSLFLCIRSFQFQHWFVSGAVYLCNKEGGEKAEALFIKLLIAPQAKAASWWRQRDRKVRTKVPPNSHRCTTLAKTGHRGPHPDAWHNMGHSVYHLANIIRQSNAFLTPSNWPSHFIIINIRYL